MMVLAIAIMVGGCLIGDTYVEAKSYGGSRSSSSSSRSSSSYSKSSWSSKPAAAPAPSKSWGQKSASVTTNKASSFGSKATKTDAQIAKEKSILNTQKAATTSAPVSHKRDVMNQTRIANKEHIAQTKAKIANTTPTDWKARRSAYTAGKTIYTPQRNQATQYTGPTRTIVINRYNNSYGGYYYNDPFNHNLIWTFSALWWYHHWDSVDKTHYADDARMKQLEAEVAKLKAQGIAQNTAYVDPNMDETVMYGDGYLEGIKAGTLTTEIAAPVVKEIVPTPVKPVVEKEGNTTLIVVLASIFCIMIGLILLRATRIKK